MRRMTKLKIYCSTCGKPAKYDLNKPKFCFQCGHSYVGGLKASLKEEVVTEESDREKIPNIDKLQVEMIFYTPQKTNIKDLARYPGGLAKKTRVSVPKRSAKEVLEEFKKEAGSLRKKNES